MPDTSQTQTFATGSRPLDLVVFMLMACLVLATSYRLRVYHRVTVVEVSVILVTQDGTRKVLPTPEEFIKMWSFSTPAKFIPRLKRQINKYMSNKPISLASEPGAHFEWIIRYSFNSGRLDKEKVIILESGHFN